MYRGHLLLTLLAAFAFASVGVAHAETADSIMGNKKANSMPKRLEPVRPRLDPNAPVNRPQLACAPYACVSGRVKNCSIVRYHGRRRCHCQLRHYPC
jgi:hypothetical protein